MKAKEYFAEPAQISLAEAIEKSDSNAIDAAIAGGADVNRVGKDQMTPLVWAIGKQSKAGFERLLERGANPNYVATGLGQHKAQVSAMELTSMAEDTDYLRLALKHGGNPNLIVSQISGETVLYTAIRNSRPKNVALLVNAGSNIDHQSHSGRTPVMRASDVTRYDIAFQLMQMGADLSIRGHVMGKDKKWRRNAGTTFPEQVQQFGDRSIRVLGREREQRPWYEKVVAELKRRGLI
jgi:ankyrin repeat protein